MGHPERSVDNRAAYDTWADTYPGAAHNPLMRLEQQIVESILRAIRSTRALDVGTGSGRYLPLLARTGATRIVGADLSLPMLRRVAETTQGSDTVSDTVSDTLVVCADARQLPFARRSFDLVNASLTVGDVADLTGWVAEMARVLDRGGHLVYSDFHPSWTHYGWKRTFRDRHGETHELEFAAHSIDDHVAALDAAGLRTDAIREPRFADAGDPSVRAFRRRWRNPPIVAVFHAVKNL